MGPVGTVGLAVTPEIAAEAAVWVTRLHGPDRNRQMQLECQAWQGRSAAHREAFERCTDTWQDVPRVTLANAFAIPKRDPAGSSAWRVAPRWAAAMAVVVVAAVLGVVGYEKGRDRHVFATGIGEQQLVVLGDGTRMSLNTDTQARVELGSDRRTVTVGRGEALFEVAKDSARPFVVRVADSEVVAVGTVFAVRLTQGRGGANPNALDVTLIEGQVTVRAAQGASGLAPERTVQMRAGERVRLAAASASSGGSSAAQVDRPNLEQLVAWRRSEAVFDDTPLADAVAEMNRYSRTPIVLVDGSGLANLRVSGVYRTGDVSGFANAVAVLHGLQSREHDGRLELTKRH